MTIYYENETDDDIESIIIEQAGDTGFYAGIKDESLADESGVTDGIVSIIKNVASVVSDTLSCPYDIQISLSIVGDERIRNINKEHRGIDAVTDVLSFPMCEYDLEGEFGGELFDTSKTIDPETDELVLGDIVICGRVIKRQAMEYGHSIFREFVFLIVHSLLHLCGYDHIDDDERKRMESMQKKIMDLLGVIRA